MNRKERHTQRLCSCYISCFFLIRCLIITLFLLVNPASGITLVEEGKTQAIIVIGKNASYPEESAANELARYIKEISGPIVNVVCEGDEKIQQYANIVLIGCPPASQKLELLTRTLSNLKDKDLKDGFVLRTVSQDAENYLLIASVLPRGCLYGVYHFLENYLNVGYFWDGDQIPHQDTLEFKEVDETYIPYFPFREVIQGCATHYTAQLWGFEEWKQEIDWSIKKKFNLIALASGDCVGRAMPLRNAMKRFGVEMAPLSEWAKYETTVFQKACEYSRRNGLKVIQPAFVAPIPNEFRDKYPDANYIEHSELRCLASYDPLFSEVTKAFIEEYNKIYGTDNYVNADPYPEESPGETEEEKARIKIEFAQQSVKIFQSVSPEMKWVMSNWAFLAWDEKTAAAFLSAIPEGMFLINDVWAEAVPLYERLNYYDGHEWGFGILHSMGGWTTLHGDMKILIDRMASLPRDPKAKKCINFYHNPEILHHNDVYFDLAIKLAENPGKLNIDSFIANYIIRRYGDTSEPMEHAWHELVASVYSTNDLGRPFYWDKPYIMEEGRDIHGDSHAHFRKYFIPHEEAALELALAEGNKFSTNTFYQRDIVDITKQYIAEVYNYQALQFFDAFRSKNAQEFERQAKILELCVESLIQILSTHPAYWIKQEDDMAKKKPIHTSVYDFSYAGLTNNGQIIRQRYTQLPGMKEYGVNLDYCSKDMYELAKFYYKKRVDVLIKLMREHFKDGKEFSQEAVDGQCKEITQTFIDTPLEKYNIDYAKTQGKTVEFAREILSKIAQTRDRIN